MERDFRAVAQSWLDGNYDEETKAEVKRLMDTDPAGLEDAFYRNLEFGTGGLRGVMGVGTNRMNKYVVAMATQGLANYILKNVPGDSHSVCVSYDSRNNSDAFAHITAEVLSANGILHNNGKQDKRLYHSKSSHSILSQPVCGSEYSLLSSLLPTWRRSFFYSFS